MYYAAIETNAKNKANYNQDQKASAKSRLANCTGEKVCPEAAPNRKQQRALRAKVAGYNETLNRDTNRNLNMSGYHKPGSHK